MKAIIFGASGQDGVLLADLLRKKSIEVIEVSRSHSGIKGDVSDYHFVSDLIKKSEPDYIFHFAANSSTSHEAMFDNHAAISGGTLNILESTRLYCPEARIFLSGSAMQFFNNGVPISEATPFESSSPYSIERIHSVYAARYFRSSFGMNIFVGYFFNHDSPLRDERHVNKKIVNAVKRIAQGSPEKLELWDVEVKKEFNYAGDIVAAVWLLVNQNMVYEAVIGSGEAYSIKKWLEICFSKINKNWQDYVVINPVKRPEYQILVSDPRLIHSLGWKPKVNISGLAEMMMQ